MLALSRPRSTCSFLLLMMLLQACSGSSGTKPTAARQFKGGAARMGVVSGFVLDDETGAPIASAQISVGGMAVRARADGSFDATVPAGRARVEVKNDGFIQTVREVAVSDIAINMPFKLARKEQPKMVGSAGGTFPFREASLTVPAGAFVDGTAVSLTYLGRVRVAVTANQPQFIDADQTPRRVVATVDLDASAPPAMPVRARVPVPADAAMDSVRGYAVGASGEWGATIMPLSVSGGFAEFALTGNSRFGVTIDARKADGKNVGYMVTEGGDAMTVGQVLAGGAEVMTASRAAAIVDPQGSRIEVAPGSRARTEVPAGETGVAGRVAAYAGMGTLFTGSVRVLVPKGNNSLIKLSLQGPAAKLDVRGTAFSVSTCESESGFVDVLTVTEGTVDAEFGGKTGPVNAGESATFCTRCAADEQPVCGATTDAGQPLPPDAMATLPPDLGIADPDVQPTIPPDAGVASDLAGMQRDADVVSPDAATRAPDAVAPPPDAAISPDLPPPPPDASVMLPPDAAAPPPDMAVLMPDAEEPAPDAMLTPDAALMPDAAPPPPDMATAVMDAQVIEEDAAPLMPDASAAKLTISPTSADYGTVEIGQPGFVDFTVTNTGDMASGMPTVQLTTDYSVEASSCTAPMAAKGTCVVRVKFIPSAAGQRSGTLLISATPGGPVMASLTGYGADAAKLDLQPRKQHLGNIPPDQTGAPVTFTVKNLGGLKSGIPSFAFQPAGAPFSISQNFCTAELDSGDTCQLAVVFNAPSTFGSVAGQLVVSAVPGGSSTSDISGNSTMIEVTPSTFDFGDVAAGTANMKLQDFTVWHLGTNGGTLTIMSMINGTDAGEFQIYGGTCINGVSPGNSCVITVAFTPRTSGAKSAQLDVAAHQATGAPQGTDKAGIMGNGL